jgi:HSP20 family protein
MLPTTTRRTLNPFAVLQREIDDVFDRAFAGDNGGTWAPAGYPVDIREHDDHLIVEAELPGFKRSEINVTLEQGVLTIEAVRKEEEKPGQPHLTERRFSRVTRSFRLGQAVDDGKVQAKLEDGVLTLTLPKRDEVKPRRIEVK